MASARARKRKAARKAPQPAQALRSTQPTRTTPKAPQRPPQAWERPHERPPVAEWPVPGCTERQKNAARRLHQLWADALPSMASPRVHQSCAAMAGSAHGFEAEWTREQHEAGREAFRRYSEAMDVLMRQAGAGHCSAVRDACVYETDVSRVRLVREGLDVLARWWGE